MSHIQEVHQADPPRVHRPDENRFQVVRSEEVAWAPSAAFPPSVRLAFLVGDPMKPGPYVIRVKMPNGIKMMPHKHPEDQVYTVISGVFYIGLGEAFDETKLVAFAPGSVVAVPGGQAHFHWAKSGDYVAQVTTIEPLRPAYVDLANDPRHPTMRSGPALPELRGDPEQRWLRGGDPGTQ